MTAHFFKDNSINLVTSQAELNALSNLKQNNLYSNTWIFETTRNRIIRVEFEDILEIKKIYPSWDLIRKFDLILISKLMWIDIAKSSSSGSYIYRLDGIKLLWLMMASNGHSRLSRCHIHQLLEFFLMNGLSKGKPISGFSARSYGSFQSCFAFSSWQLSLSNMGLDFLSYDITQSVIEKGLKQLISNVTNEKMTYADWSAGGSLNTLTLDHGQYYVQHCLEFFEANLPLAKALARTYRANFEISNKTGYSKTTVSQVVPLVLEGSNPKEISDRWPTWSKATISNIYDEVAALFMNEYKDALAKQAIIDDNTIEVILEFHGLTRSTENIDRMKVLVWGWLNKDDDRELQKLLIGFERKIYWSYFSSNLKKRLNELKSQSCDIPDRSYYTSIGLHRDESKIRSLPLPRQLINLVAKAGLASVVALTGWRKSELGYPMSSIVRSINTDKLDQYAFPYRYQVNWYVFKTNGTVKQLREVTFNTVLISKQLQELLGTPNEKPCLYVCRNTKNRSHDSGSVVSQSVRSIWGHFIWNYKGFKLLDKSFSTEEIMDTEHFKRCSPEYIDSKLKRLRSKTDQNQHNNIAFDMRLIETYNKVRLEWPRVELFFDRGSPDKKDWLSRYVDKTLKKTWSEILDVHLSDSIKEWIFSLPKEDLKSNLVVKTVTSYLMENTVYPTPHGFRHMWAEAVYRRFDGDAGWMIRSQFKHISRTMWLAYIRDKDNRHFHQGVKYQVINSLVYNYIVNKGERYSGLMQKKMRRLLKMTSVLSPSEQAAAAEQWASYEIEDIKANPWGYCLISRRTRSKANCAQNGEPSPQNASPDLCLNCIHSLMQSENVEWVLFHIASHVEALKNPIVPKVFKDSSYQLIKKAVRQVKTLDSQHQALDELQPLLDSYNEREK